MNDEIGHGGGAAGLVHDREPTVGGRVGHTVGPWLTMRPPGCQPPQSPLRTDGRSRWCFGARSHGVERQHVQWLVARPPSLHGLQRVDLHRPWATGIGRDAVFASRPVDSHGVELLGEEVDDRRAAQPDRPGRQHPLQFTAGGREQNRHVHGPADPSDHLRREPLEVDEQEFLREREEF